MIKVLQVIGGLNRGGAETMMMNIFRKVDKVNYQFYFLVFYPSNEHQDYEEEIINLGGKIINLHTKNIFFNFVNFCKILQKYKFDVIHVNTLFNSFLYIFPAMLFKVRIRITHSHSTGNMLKKNLVSKIYMSISRKIINISSNVYIACSVDAGYYLFGKDIFKNKGIVLNNSVDTNLFHPQKIENNYPGIEKDTLLIGCIGSFYNVKNHIFLINLAEYIVKNNLLSNFKFIFIGKGYLENELKREIANKKLDDYFVFLGTRTDIDKLMNILDILVMPSLYEGIPVTLIEAQACGLPCIVSNRISKDVDLNLNLISFYEINDNYSKWVSAIKENCNKHLNENDFDYIQDRLIKAGYSLEENVKKLLNIYCCAKK